MSKASGSPRAGGLKTPSRIARRGFILGGLSVVAAGGFATARWYNISAEVGEGALSAPAAFDAAQAGRIVLVDIRRPGEWARTGVPQGGVPIDMRRADFTQALLAHTAGARDVPVALICARGVRSARLTTGLQAAGFTQILDVPEGMRGSGAGPGWIARGLPVTQA